ncbi:hypothetical protein M408DRAFT_331846 [Serendipita vermifera MAFF 305830]|uniref:Uncharacterized protein n=1 Tax=Serendipita vermifera MAFF 305830 TaxID=933852 RepID=A0A0C3AYK0_SERVB|nr:hypothetical protein M408DRAFT_331846 [Serendipita vermifera MAFF 305830]
MYDHRSTAHAHNPNRLPEQLIYLRLYTPAMLTWDALRELLLNKPTGLRKVAASINLDCASLKWYLSRNFPRVVVETRSSSKYSSSNDTSAVLDLSQM